MTIVEITGGMLRAARSLTGLSQQELADRAAISRPCLTTWEGSSGSVPNAGVRALRSRRGRARPRQGRRVALHAATWKTAAISNVAVAFRRIFKDRRARAAHSD
jgi:transcriptional regulator with XRE-family HTH domain